MFQDNAKTAVGAASSPAQNHALGVMGGVQSSGQASQESVSTVLPRLYGLSRTVREYAAKQACVLKGIPPQPIEGAPMRDGLVGSLLDLEDILRGAIQWMDDTERVLNG